MSEFETAERSISAPGLPVVIESQRPRPSLHRSETTAAFVSHLIAARANMAPQRAKRRSSVGEAVSAYRTGASIGVVRMPQGYRTTVLA
ncbi:hypothetical protein [Devosia sp.]|uniref:hypothetical protein n=1 Tax=Devosia sp. TaxID=1871048 RepID=UPI0032656E7F